MQRFLKCPTRLAISRTGKFRQLNHGPRRRAPATMLAYSAALEELEVSWFRRSQEQSIRLLKIFEESKAVWSKSSEEEQVKIRNEFKDKVKSFNTQWAKMFEDFDVEQKQREKEANQLAGQNFELFYAALDERTQRMRLEGKYNVCGALERIVYVAKLLKKVLPTAGVQEGLDELAQGDEFTAILHKEVQARNLGVAGVMAEVNHLYEEVSNRTDGNDDIFDNIIIVRTAKFNDNERAALAIFLKVQGDWKGPLKWREGNIM